MADVMTKEERSRCMAAIKGRDTRPEMIVRRYLFSRGLRYRVNDRRLPGSPDIVLKRYRTVVFIDGCFWHGHAGCRYYRQPKTNIQFWRQKIATNQSRDYVNTIDLQLAGWRVIRIWECEIKLKKDREARLQLLYRQITESEKYPDSSNAPSIAAEPPSAYGPLHEKQ